MYKKIILLFSLMLFMTGCIQTDTQLTIDKDGIVDVQYKAILDKEAFSSSMKQQGMTSEEFKDSDLDKKKIAEMEQKLGMKLEPINNEKEIGTIGKRKIKNLQTDDWNTQLDTEIYLIETKNKDGKIISVKKGFLKTEYIIDMDITAKMDTFSDSSMQTPDATPNQEMLDFFSKFFTNTYSIKPPCIASKHNSTQVDTNNLLYKWELKPNKPVAVQLTFGIYNKLNIAFSAILVLALLFTIISAKRKENQ